MNEWMLLETIAQTYRDILGDNLLGVYAHGSMAFGCFRWEVSDIDFLVVTCQEPDLPQKVAMIEALLRLKDQAPPKGFEMSVVCAADCRAVQHPIPFSLHYSNGHLPRAAQETVAYCEHMHGCDPDLAAHFTVARAAGKAVYGPPVEEVFGPIPREAYVDSIRSDVAEAVTEVVHSPVYIILNLCRVLACLREEKVLSKQQGGEWGLKRLPEQFSPVIRAALEDYTASAPYTLPPEEGQAFARWALSEILS